MKKITLREATEEQIINAVKNNPELFGFNIPQTNEELIDAAMEDNNWQIGYEEHCNMYDDSLSFREYVESYINNYDYEPYITVYSDYEESDGVECVRIDWRMEDFFKTESGWFDLDKEIEVE